MWGLSLFGSTEPARTTKVSAKDRPPLSTFLAELNARELSGLSARDDGQGGGDAVPSASFMVVPLQTIGKRVDHNAETANAVLSFTEERARQLQRMLRDQRKKTTAIAIPSNEEFSDGSLERALGELNRISDSEIQATHTRASALEIRVRQQLALARENAVACGADYEAELHSCERSTQRARDKLQRSKVSHGRAIERLTAVQARAKEPPPPPSLLSLGRPDRRDPADNEHDIAEAQEAVANAAQQIDDDSEQILRCLYDQDRVAAAVALAFEACDIRLRDAVAQSIRTFIDVEMEAAQKRLEDLTSVSGLLDGISSTADSADFIATAKRPDLTHMQSAALSLLHNPENRGASFAFSLSSPEQPRLIESSSGAAKQQHRHSSPPPESSSLTSGSSAGTGTKSEDSDGTNEAHDAERDAVQRDVDACVVSLFAPGGLGEREREKLAGTLQSDHGRSSLIHSLNQQRSRRTEIAAKGFTELANAVLIVLDKCLETKDVQTAKMAMMLSQTFYREEAGSGGDRKARTFLKSSLLHHPLWRDVHFWDESCWTAIRESLSEGASTRKWHAMTPDEARDAVLRVHNIVFSNVGAYAHSMVEFGCDRALAEHFVHRICSIYQLQEDQRESLCRMLQPRRGSREERAAEKTR